MIGETIALSRQNHADIQQLLRIVNENNLNIEQHILDRKNELGTRVEQHINTRANELGIRFEEHLLARKNELSFQLQISTDELKKLKTQIDKHDMISKLQNEIAAVNTSAFSDYKNAHVGEDIVLVAAGPTLNKFKQIKDAIHIGVNSVFMNNEIKLDYYFTQDFKRRGAKSASYEQDVINLKCKKFFGMLTTTPNGIIEPSESLCIEANASRYFVDESPSKDIYADIRYHPLMDFYTIAFPALHFALFTNPRRIYLVGCDTSFNGYFTKEKSADTVEEARIILSNRMIGFRRFKEFAETWYPDTEIISVNPVNLEGFFRDMYTDEQGILVDGTEVEKVTDSIDLSDDGLKRFADSHIESVLLERLHDEKTCKECGSKYFSMTRGLSDLNPDNIEVKCEKCERRFCFFPETDNLDICNLLSPRYNNDGESIVELSDVETLVKSIIINKFKEKVYQTERVICICSSVDYECIALKNRFGIPQQLVICRHCGLIMINPRMNAAAYKIFYKEEYRRLYGFVDKESYFMFQKARGEKIKEILEDKKILNSSTRILEIGCGSGGILKSFHDEGYYILGIDLDSEFIEFGKSKGLRLMTCHSNEVIEESCFDVIILSHVVEHFLDLKSEFDAVRHLLSESGTVYIEVPNIIRDEDYDFLSTLANAHTYYFSAETLVATMKVLGYHCVFLNLNDPVIEALFITDYYEGILKETAITNQYRANLTALFDNENRYINNRKCVTEIEYNESGENSNKTDA